MRYNLLSIMLLILICIPIVHATEGWYYSGDTFKIGDTLYSVEGNDYSKVLFGVNNSLYVINFNECAQEGLVKYCYAQSAYPADSGHIKYAAGHQYYGYYMTITDITPTIVITRTVEKNDVNFGEHLPVRVSIQNTGDYSIYDFNYTEDIPQGFILDNGGKSVHYTAKTLGVGTIQAFSYTIIPTDYLFASLTPIVNYKYLNKTYDMPVPVLGISVDTPALIKHYSSSTLNLGDVGVYSLNITNSDDQLQMNGIVNIAVPEQFYIIDSPGLKKDNATYSAVINLNPGDTAYLKLDYGTSYGGSYKISTNISATVGNTPFSKYAEDLINANADKLVPLIKFSSSRASFKPGEQILISALLSNSNAKTTFTGLTGTLSAPGLFENKSFSHESFPPQKNITEFEEKITLPQVDVPTTKTISFKGKYLSPSNELINFEETKDILIEPVKNYIAFTRTITPDNVVQGTNFTVLIHAKNIYNEYISFVASESYDSVFTRVGGITYGEVSLNRDEEKDVYIYQLSVPNNITGQYNITTSVLVKGETYPEKHTMPINIGFSPDKMPVVNATKNETGDANLKPDASANPDSKEPTGFFSKIWYDIKKWFNS